MFIDGVARGIWVFLPVLIVDLRGNILDVAFLSTLPGLASTFMQLPWGMVTTNHSRNKQLWAAGYLIIAAQAVPIAFATTPWQVIFLSTLRSLFAAPMGLANSLFYWAALKPEIRARFMSLNNSVGFLGVTLGSLFAGYLIQGHGYTLPFVIFSLLNAVCALIILRLRDVEHSADSASSRQLFREGFSSIGRSYQELPRWLREEKDYTMYCIGIAVRGLGLAITGPIFTVHLKENLNATSTQIGELSALSSLVRMIVMPILGWIADRRSRKQVFLAGVVLAMIHPIIYVTRSTVEQLYPVYVMNGLFWACIESAWFAWQMDIIPARRGIYMAILSFFNGTEWAIGPIIGGFIGGSLGFAPAAGLSSVAIGVGFWRLVKVPEHLKGHGEPPSSSRG